MQYLNPGKIHFTAKIIDEGSGGAYIEFPYDVTALYGVKGRVPVIATFENSIKYTGSMVKMGTDCHIVIVLKSIREQLKKTYGDNISVDIELDLSKREVTLPKDVQAVLGNNSCAANRFNALSYSHKREYLDWINDAKRPETRARRIEKLIATISA